MRKYVIKPNKTKFRSLNMLRRFLSDSNDEEVVNGQICVNTKSLI